MEMNGWGENLEEICELEERSGARKTRRKEKQV